MTDALPDHPYSETVAEACRARLMGVLTEAGVSASDLAIDMITGQILAIQAETRSDPRYSRAEQRGRLELLGLKPLQARHSLERLGLPDAVPAAEDLVTPHTYHPIRVRAILDDNPETPRPPGGPGFDGVAEPGASAVVRAVKAKLIRRLDTLLPWDQTALKSGLFDVITLTARAAVILDAEHLVDGYADRTPDRRDLETIEPGRQIYVHFGRDALPSPYPGLGIEGCYVVRATADDPETAFALIPVISEPRISNGPVDHVVKDRLVRAVIDHSRGVALRYDADLKMIANTNTIRFSHRPEVGAVSGSWIGHMDRILPIVAGVLADVAHATVPARRLQALSEPDSPEIAVLALGTAPVSAQYPDAGGGFPLNNAYWPIENLEAWINGFIAQFKEDDTPSARDDQCHRGWMDRAVRLVQQAVPERVSMPDLADRPATRTAVRNLLITFPIEGCSLMPFWSAVRWLLKMDPFAGQTRIHAMLVHATKVPDFDSVLHVLMREMPKEPVIRRHWAEVAQCLADNRDTPYYERPLAGLVARAYTADPALAERIIAQGCSPATMAEQGFRDAQTDEDLAVLSVYGDLLRDLVRTLPQTMALLRMPTHTRH